MLDRYTWILDRYMELTEMISQAEVISDPPAYQAALKERAYLEKRVEAYRQYQQLLEHLAQARQMADDPDLAELAQEEAAELESQKAVLEQELQLLLLPEDPDDERSVVMEIRAGAGGEEASLFAADLMRMYEHFAQRHHFRIEPVSLNDTELGGFKEAVFLVTGAGAFSWLKYESGVHRVQRVPITDTTGKKQTSTCTVAVLPEAEEVDLVLNPGDLRIDVYRSTGHGGQYINTTDSAVRIVHLPTGITVTCQDQKSQLRNRETAMKLLRSRILESMRSQADAAYAERRRVQVGTGDRSERIRTYNFHEGRVTDHRIGLTLYRIDDIMNGDLDEIIQGLKMEEQARKLQELAGQPSL